MKKSIFRLLTLLLVIFISEVIFFVGYSAAEGALFSFSRIADQQEKILQERTGTGLALTSEVRYGLVIHPYTGFVREPGSGENVNAYGLHGPPDIKPFFTGPGDATVAITGGSVAMSFYYQGQSILLEYIERIPQFAGKNIRIIFLGLGVWKQPQQLLNTAYYLSLGGKIDLLINLDGYNEIAGAFRNYEEGVFAGYPSNWSRLAASVVDPEELKTIGLIVTLRERRAGIAQAFKTFKYSVAMCTIWRFIDKQIEYRISGLQMHLRLANSDLKDYRKTGPADTVKEEDLEEFSSNLWLNSSLQMSALANCNGTSYFHFLQPNQYVGGSKRLSARERKESYRDPFLEVDNRVRQGYEVLVNKAKFLTERGVKFYSLTHIYETVEETIYRDRCCHVNKRGNEIMAHAMGKIIHENY